MHDLCEKEEYNGWVRHDTDEDAIEWWRGKSTHIRGVCERVRIVSHTFREKTTWKARKTVKNEFGRGVNQRVILEKDTRTLDESEAKEWVLDSAQRHLDKHGGDGEFTTPPVIPEDIGDWSGVETKRKVFQWEIEESGETVAVEYTDIDGRYMASKALYTTIYSNKKEEIETHIVGNEAHEYAIRGALALMNCAPSGGLLSGEGYEELQDVKGIGPAKARDLRLQGVSDPHHLRAVVANLDHFPRKRRERIQKILTSQIEESIQDVGQDDGGDPLTEPLPSDELPEQVALYDLTEYTTQGTDSVTQIVWEDVTGEGVVASLEESGWIVKERSSGGSAASSTDDLITQNASPQEAIESAVEYMI